VPQALSINLGAKALSINLGAKAPTTNGAPMLELTGYTAEEKFYEDEKTIVYRGYRTTDRLPVIIKTLASPYPEPRQIARFHHEYEITKGLNLKGIIKPYCLQKHKNRWVLILEDIQGDSLKHILATQPIFAEKTLGAEIPKGLLAFEKRALAGISVEKGQLGRIFLDLAIQLADSLGELHAHHIIHKDIKPANIIVNLETGLVKLTDLSISSRLSLENQTIINPNLLEGTLAYMSPEQTGRMNRALDYRTDFYSLGIVFYEMLVGHPPFESTDALELVHCHIAKHPPSPHTLNANIPKTISHIVMKLLAKTAEARYQSAYGLKADLQACLQQLQVGALCERFALGQQDVSDKFQIPQKLYGRDTQIETLLQAFERVSAPPVGGNSALEKSSVQTSEVDLAPLRNIVPSEARSVWQTEEVFTTVGGKGVEMMLVAGYSGIGKSALVQEIYKPITQKHGYFMAGKFDQYQRNIPYSAVVNAFTNLVRQLLTETQEQLNQWREKLIDALGENGQVICEVIPEVELIIGKQAPVPALPPLEAQNRFNLVFQNFIKVFTQPKHPLALFLDDLQWADSASLKLIQLLMTAPDSEYLFLIGAYRDNEVSATHPLMLTLDDIKKSPAAIVNHITLMPLELSDVNQLIADTLKCSIETAKPLAELVLAKTGGNPFFMNEFLKSLYADKLITFIPPKSPTVAVDDRRVSVDKGGFWQWDLAQIQAQVITDNIVDFMAGKIKKLSESTQHLLKLAACIGNQFELETLSIVSEKTPTEIVEQLHEAVFENLMLPLGDAYKAIELMELEKVATLDEKLTVEYKFSHDRIQQAAYFLIPEAHRQVVHQQVGQLLLQNTPPEQLEEKIFDIVNQLNFGTELLNTQSQRDELAQLNLMAGKKAKAAAAYEPALKYLNVGIKLLGEASWQPQYQLTLALYIEGAETAYLSGDFEQMETLAQTVLQRAQTLLDKVSVSQVKIDALQAQNQLREGLKTGLEVLKLLGFTFPETPSQADFMSALQELQSALAGKRIEDLINLPEMTDSHPLAAVRIFSSIFSASYQAAPALMPLLVFKQVQLSVQSGNTAESAFAYANYGLILCAIVSDIDSGYQFGQLALKLLERFNAKELKARTFVIMNNLVRHWKEHVKASLPPLLEGYQSGLETGDLEWAAWCIVVHYYHAYLIGRELTKLDKEMALYNEAIAGLKQETPLHWQEIYRQAVLNLMGRAEGSPTQLVGESYNEAKMLPLHLEANDRTVLSHFYLNKIILYYMFEEYAQAVENASLAEPYLDGAVGLLVTPVFYFYDSLAKLAVYSDSANPEQILDKVTANQEKMKTWAHHAPDNFQHKYDLVEAEKARVLGKVVEAMACYDKAIQGARKHEYLQEEALAYERAADFYLALGREEIAQTYMTRAHYGYTVWGAQRKVIDLMAKYPKLLATASASTMSVTETRMTVTGTSTLLGVGSAFDLSTVIKASQAITSEIKLDKLLAKLMTIAIENAGAQKGFFIMVDKGELILQAAGEVDKEVTVLQAVQLSVISHQLSVAIVNYVARTYDNVVLNDASHEGIFTEDSYIVKNQPKSVLCAPIIQQGKLIGLIYLENNLTTEAFTPDRLEVIKILSAQAAVSIENALLYRTLEQKVEERTAQLAQANTEISALNERLKEDNLRMSAELEVAEKLQKMVLPTDAELKRIDGLDIAGFMAPADEVGGDYYDVLEHEGRVKIAIGDVTGHGLKSGVLMLMVQMAVRTLLVNEVNPERFLNVLNRAVYDNVQRMSLEKNLTLCLLDYQPLTACVSETQPLTGGILRLTGQHEEVLVVRLGGKVERIDTFELGFLIGVESDIADFVAQQEITLQPGEGVVLYTDGLTEARNPEKVQYGIERLCEVVSSHWHLCALEIQQAVIADVRRHIGEQKVFDDLTLLVLKQKDGNVNEK
jgi:predicted ATPase/serine phosphatase RsbU (regulator of sigma subunit)/tRNA A-37 threonylcarbamoyl transferase component Bud32